MSTGRLTLIATLVLLLVASLTAPALAAKRFHAGRFDVTLVVERGGSMLVTERIQFSFGPDTFTTVYRGLPVRRTDGLTIISASMDGRGLSRGNDPGQFEVKPQKDGLREIVWHFEPVTAATHSFELTYRVHGVVRVEQDRDVLEWNALPTRHAYAIDCASIDVESPATAPLAATPETEPASERIGRAPLEHFERCGFKRDDRWLIRVAFAPRSIVAAPPAWQQRDARVSRGLPLFLGLAGMILLAGVGGFVAFYLNHRLPVRAERQAPVSTPPDALPIPLGAALARGGGATWSTGLATMFDLAARGVLLIEEIPGSFLRKRDFEVSRRSTSISLRPSERAFCQLLFKGRDTPGLAVKFSEFARIFRSPRRWRTFPAAVTAELRQLGFIDEDRERAKSRATVVALSVLGLGLVSFCATIPFVNTQGGPPLMIGGAFMLTGIVGLIMTQSVSSLTDEARRRAGRWLAYGRQLKENVCDPHAAAATANGFAQTLPAAVAFGVAIQWAKALRKQGVTAGPAWLSALGQADGHMDSTIAMLTTSTLAGAHVDHSSGVAGASASAAGGGTSGAH
jgi:hypothetical protein